jgi:heme O synthase-like polyprenyltransferase
MTARWVRAGLGPLYAVTACLLGAGFIYLTLRMKHGQDPRPAKHLYGYSVVYIAVLFAAMILDRVTSGTGDPPG